MLGQRRTGILCHLTSLPAPHLGQDGAHRFLETLQGMGVGVWQMLPIHPPDPHGLMRGGGWPRPHGSE